MIIDLPATTTHDVNKALVHLREEGGAVALGRVLTLVIDTERDDVEDAIAAANEASREHPCRIIVLTRGTGEGEQLDAQIRVGGDAGASEVVVLRRSGRLTEHGDTLVIPLLLPDAPIVAWWPHEPPANPAEHPVGRMAQRRITDTVACSSPSETLRRLSRVHVAGDTDLSWTRLTPWRALLATTLDQPPFEEVTRAGVTGNPAHPSTDLLAAWLAQALRCPVDVTPWEGVGILGVSLERPSGTISITRPDGKNARMTQPNQPERRIALPLRQVPECLTEELRRLDPDEVYGETLTEGLRLLEEHR